MQPLPLLAHVRPLPRARAVTRGRLANGLEVVYREGTSDHNSLIACAVVDEYKLAEFDVAGKVVFDIGAHVGGVSLLAALLGARTVVAVEPVPDNVDIIRSNVELNGLGGIISVLPYAAGAPGTLDVHWGWSGEGAYGELTGEVHAFIGNTGLVQSGYVPTHSISVKTVTMADLVETFGLPHLVKLDCEGGEWPILEEPITGTIPNLVGEYHPWVGAPRLDGTIDFEDNRAEVLKRIGKTHEVEFAGPDGVDAGFFRATLRA